MADLFAAHSYIFKICNTIKLKVIRFSIFLKMIQTAPSNVYFYSKVSLSPMEATS